MAQAQQPKPEPKPVQQQQWQWKPRGTRARLLGVVHRDADAFAAVSEVAGALAKVDRLCAEFFPSAETPSKAPLEEGASVFRFQVGSEPQFIIELNPGWISVFLTIFFGYPKVKESAREIASDARRALDAVHGLSEAQRRDVEIGLRLLAVSIAERGEQFTRSLSRKLSRIRRALEGAEGFSPSLRVVYEDESHEG